MQLVQSDPSTQVGWGLVARADIPAGIFLDLFVGVVLPDGCESLQKAALLRNPTLKGNVDEYSLDGVLGMSYRNLGWVQRITELPQQKGSLFSRAQDSFPNMSLINPGRGAFVALTLEELRAGTPICWDYGASNGVKSLGHFELFPARTASCVEELSQLSQERLAAELPEAAQIVTAPPRYEALSRNELMTVHLPLLAKWIKRVYVSSTIAPMLRLFISKPTVGAELLNNAAIQISSSENRHAADQLTPEDAITFDRWAREGGRRAFCTAWLEKTLERFDHRLAADVFVTFVKNIDLAADQFDLELGDGFEDITAQVLKVYAERGIRCKSSRA